MSEKRTVVLSLEIEGELHAVTHPARLGGRDRDSRLDLALPEEHGGGEGGFEGQLHANVALVLLDGRLAAAGLHEHPAPVFAIRRTGRHGDHHTHYLSLSGLKHHAAREDTQERGERGLARSGVADDVDAEDAGSVGYRIPESDRQLDL